MSLVHLRFLLQLAGVLSVLALVPSAFLFIIRIGRFGLALLQLASILELLSFLAHFGFVRRLSIGLSILSKLTVCFSKNR